MFKNGWLWSKGHHIWIFHKSMNLWCRSSKKSFLAVILLFNEPLVWFTLIFEKKSSSSQAKLAFISYPCDWNRPNRDHSRSEEFQLQTSKHHCTLSLQKQIKLTITDQLTNITKLKDTSQLKLIERENCWIQILHMLLRVFHKKIVALLNSFMTEAVVI